MFTKPLAYASRPAEILLVEDNYGDVLLTREAFSAAKISHNISVAADGEVALEMLQREGVYTETDRPDLILLDLNLPKRDGREVLRFIKDSPELRHIPVIVFTSSQADADISKSYDLHANSYVVKPTDLEKFDEIVEVVESFWFKIAVLSNRPGMRH